MSDLVLVYEKEVALVPKSGKIVVKINRVISSYITDAPTAKSDMSQKEKSLEEFIVSNIIDGIKIKLTERCQFKVNQ